MTDNPWLRHSRFLPIPVKVFMWTLMVVVATTSAFFRPVLMPLDFVKLGIGTFCLTGILLDLGIIKATKNQKE